MIHNHANTIDRGPKLEADHLVVMVPGRWYLWRWFCLRSAGFPASGVLRLAATDCARQADLLIDLEDEAERRWDEAFRLLQQRLKESAVDNRSLVCAMRRLKKGKIPEPLDEDSPAQSAIARFSEAFESVDAATSLFREEFLKTNRQLSRNIVRIAAEQRFQEAVLWQNRAAYHSVIEPLLKEQEVSESRNQRRRRNEELVAIYWQRYCVKNDTIGFFGPVGWGRFVDEGAALDARPGPNTISRRSIHFEQWGIDALARVISNDVDIQPWITPRRLPSIHLEGTRLRLPFNDAVELKEEEARLLFCCDGNRTAREIAAALSGTGLKTTGEIYNMLAEFQRRGFIVLEFGLPPSLQPESHLAALLDTIDDDSVRARAGEGLRALESARAAIAEADTPEALNQSIGVLNAEFTRITGLSPSRSEGKTYAGRTLVHQDSLRDLEIELGPAILEDLADPLSLLLDGARWITCKAIEVFRKPFEDLYDQMASETRSATIDATSYWARAERILDHDQEAFAESIQRPFQEKWARILSLDGSLTSCSYTSDALKTKSAGEFEPATLGWQRARYQCPDLMIAARDADAIRNKDYQVVLGELHMSTNTLSYGFFVEHHPDPGSYFRALAEDLPEPRLVLQSPRYWTGRVGRGHNIMISAKDYVLEMSFDSVAAAGTKTLPIGLLTVERSADQLVVRTRDKRITFDILEAFADLISDRIVNYFKIVPPRRHNPRIVIDRLIVSREAWRFAPSEIEFAFEKDEAYRFIEARRWARKLGLPRMLFYKSPVEVKPCFLDFDSPVYLNIFARMVRQADGSLRSGAGGRKELLIVLTEMLPTLEQSWLPDSSGDHYTSEFRVVAVAKDQAFTR
jgi:hypothetical protein